MSNRETSASIVQWGAVTFGEVADLTVLTRRARAEFEELDAAVRAGDVDEMAREAADVAILLHRLVGLIGKDLAAEIDAKMTINRNRQWRLSGDGVGQHE